MNRTLGALLAATFPTLLLLSGCATTVETPHHPLNGHILHGENAAELDAPTLLRRMATSDVVYLAESHDNPHHHAIQLRVLRELVALGKRPIVGFEMFSTEQTSLLTAFVSHEQSPHDTQNPAQRLRQAVGWPAESDWHWRAYGPLLELARHHGLMVFGADLPVALRRVVARTGVAELNPVERAQIPAGPAPPADYAALMRARIRKAHCGYGSAEYLDRLLENWVARNETMARNIVRMLDGNRTDRPVVLIVGSEHVRNDGGVMARVARLAPDASQLNLGLKETDLGRLDGREYMAPVHHQDAIFAAEHQYLWLTPSPDATRPDRCALFRMRGQQSPSG